MTNSMELLIADWKHKSIAYELEHTSGCMRRAEPRNGREVNGFLWACRNSKSLICYSDNRNVWLRYGSVLVSMSDPSLCVSLKRGAVFLYCAINHPSLELTIREFTVFKLAIARIDPTYDWLDFSTDFFGVYLYEKYDIAQKAS